MKIVIDIPENLYKAVINGPNPKEIWYLRSAIENGIQLPEWHGRLIDADDIDNHIVGHVDTRSCPTIIEAC